MESGTSEDNLLELELIVNNPRAEPRKLSLRLLEDITNNFCEKEIIGRGGFAAVYRGSLKSGTTVAVKRLFETFEARDKEKFLQEVDALMAMKHKNIVRFLGYCYVEEMEYIDFQGRKVMAAAPQRFLCFECLPKGSLYPYITDARRGLEWKTRYRIIKGICEGLHYLHSEQIVHLDLKPANILLDDHMEPKIADFGLSRCFEEKQSKIITLKACGTPGYMAPECFTGVITFKLDIYSLGVIILEMLTGEKTEVEKGQKGHPEVKDVRTIDMTIQINLT